MIPDLEFYLWILCNWFPISVGLTQFWSDERFYLNLFAFLFGYKFNRFDLIEWNFGQIQPPDSVWIEMKFEFEFHSNGKDFAEINWFDVTLFDLNDNFEQGHRFTMFYYNIM